MVDYNIIENKNKLTNSNNEEYLDLLSNSFNKNVEIYGDLVYINEYYVARPDLVSLAKYGTDKYADIICKVNGISNPFELNKGMYIMVPSVELINTLLAPTGYDSDIIDSSNDKLYHNVSTYQKFKDDTRSPNQQIVGKSNYVIDKSLGVIFY